VTTAMQADFKTFLGRLASAYFTKVRGALTATGTKALYLGCRFWYQTPEVVAAAGAVVDVLSFNDYSLPDQLNWAYYNSLPKPVIISEWSCPVNSEGSFGYHNFSRQQRALEVSKVYSYALGSSNIIGLHLFELYDEPATNRGDNWENLGLGIVDICDTPKVEHVAAMRQIMNSMFTVRR